MIGSYGSLINVFSWLVWVIYGMTVFGVIILRLRMPEKRWKRAIRAPMWLSLVFTVVCLMLVAIPLTEDPWKLVIAVLLLLCSYPCFLLIYRWKAVHG